ARREIKSVALNQKARAAEREARDARELELENQMRRALGKAAAESHKALEEENEEQNRAYEAGGADPEPDAFLRESGRILSDYLHALGGRLAGVGQDGAPPLGE
ncbi:MAG: carboxy terminal-processing peptidase, partial [Gammaproteobacteria bacterium]